MKLYEWMQAGVIFFEAAACITGFIFFTKWKKNFWRFFPFYLALIVAADLAGTYFITDNDTNSKYYSWVIMPFEFLFFIWLYFQHFKTTRYKAAPVIAAIVFIAGCILSALPEHRNGNYWSMPVSYMTGVIVQLCLVILFFVHFFAGDDILNFKSNMLFWVSIGLLLFYLVSAPFFVLREILYNRYKEIFWPYYHIQFVANYLMYILFSIAFIWGRHR